jgi:hypothetical protein
VCRSRGCTSTAGPGALARRVALARGGAIQEIPRGIATTLAGRATFDLERGAFTAFEALAIGRRWGRSPLNGRGRDASPGTVGFHLALAPADLRIAPTFLSLYEADWVKKPAGWAEHPENRP